MLWLKPASEAILPLFSGFFRQVLEILTGLYLVYAIDPQHQLTRQGASHDWPGRLRESRTHPGPLNCITFFQQPK